MRFEFEGIVVIASYGQRGSHDVALRIGDGQDVGRFGSLASLVGRRLAAFLGDDVTAVEVDFRQIQIALDRQNAGLPHLLQAAIPAPLAKMVVNRVMADLFFSGSSESGSIGNWSHWHPVCRRYRM